MKRGKINQVQLACDLADEKLLEIFGDKKITRWDKDSECVMYTAKAQKVFEKWYNHYWDMIDNTKE
jgi:hypothetical protein